MGRFEGKVALVTGATQGIGQAIAVRLAQEGALVGVNHLGHIDPAETLAKVAEAGGQAFPVAADMRNPQQVIDMVHEVARRGGRFDYLVSNAAINPMKAWDEFTLEEYDEIQEVNQRGTWVVCQTAAKQMIAEGHPGAIVCISSMSALVAAREQTIYCGTKGGVSMLVKALAAVLGPHGIRINAILPGAILTPMSADLMIPGSPSRQYYESRIPLGRIGEPREIASAAAFLLSDDASYITSAELLIDGGFVTNAE
jgi:NAD(P)-dependent dehydrogenase (short-subunit alcohol dehydrogenase family)